VRDSRHLAFCIASTVMIVLASGLLLVTCTAGDMVLENKAHTDAWRASPLQYATEGTFSPVSTPTGTLLEPFYGTHFVLSSDLGTVRELGVEVVLTAFPHDGTPESWLAYLDAAQVQDIQAIAWLWPQGWTWDGTAWRIDDQAELFVRTVAGHPALFAVYALHEPYWNGCLGCGYTTTEQQALYSAIKAIADVPIHSAVDSMSAWTAYGEETAFAEGICDYCETWYHPLLEDGTYERERLLSQLTADLAVARERAPNSRIVWSMQCFAQSGAYRMPTADEMRDVASIVYATDIDGALWYPWTFGDLYSDFLSNHPELYPVVREVYEEYVLAKYPRRVHLSIVYRQGLQERPIAAPTATMDTQCLDSWQGRQNHEY